jgi:signal transduction histidine kinase/DNA-binding response OmpR family regulator
MGHIQKSKIRSSSAGRGFAYAIITISALAIFGWFFNFPVLKQVLHGSLKMNPISITLFLLSGISLLNTRKKNKQLLYSTLPAIFIIVVAALKLSMFVTGYDIHIDTILNDIGSGYADRMAPNTAFNFLMGGLALYLITRKSITSIIIAQVLALLCFFIALLAIMGYIYTIKSLYVVNAFIPMALHTALCFILLALGIFFAKAYSGIIGVIAADRMGGSLARRLLPVAILLPLILGWLHFEATRSGVFSENLSVSLVIIVLIVAFSIIIWVYAQSLNKIDTERREAEKSLVIAKNISEKARKSQELFLANMSHEIRTPMNGVIGMTSLLQGTSLTDDQLNFVETIRISGESLLVIINDILDFSKIEAGKMHLEEQPFSVQSAIEETFDLLAGEANKKNIDLVYTIDTSVPPLIIGDITRVRQILVNLVSNGIKFTEKGEVLVSVGVNTIDTDAYELEFSVRDSGIGIPEDKMDRLFKAFSQADVSTTRSHGGTGLGLVICAKLVQMMHGKIAVESQPGVGSVFFFTIKVKMADGAAEHTDLDYENLKGKSILIIDDNKTNLLILQKHCEGWAMKVTCCATGKEAVEMANENLYDLIITDMMMAEMDGTAASQAIKNTKNRDTPIVLLSSSGADNTDDTGRDKLFLMKLMKPVRLYQLCQVLNSIMAENDNLSTRTEKPVIKNEIDGELGKRIPLRILVAEDNMINQKIALKVLERLGYKADLAANGLEAIDAVKRQHYDLILMDMIMPEMDGLEATRAIRALRDLKQPTIIALTANAMQGEREKCMECGMNDFLPKPFQIIDLERVIIKWKAVAAV